MHKFIKTRTTLLAFIVICFAFPISINAQKSPFQIGAKWYYHSEDPLWYFAPPENDINKAVRSIGCAIYEVKNYDKESNSYTVERTLKNDKGDILSTENILVSVKGNKIFMKADGKQENLVHDPDLQVGDEVPLQADIKEGTDKYKAVLQITETQKRGDEILYRYSIFIKSTDNQQVVSRIYYTYSNIYGVLDNGFYPELKELSAAMRSTDYEIKYLNEFESYLRAYVNPSGEALLTDWWKSNEFYKKGYSYDFSYYRPASINQIDNHEPLQVNYADKLITSPKAWIYLYSINGSLVSTRYESMELENIKEGCYVAVSRDSNFRIISTKKISL